MGFALQHASEADGSRINLATLLLETVAQELVDELADMPSDEFVRGFLSQAGELISWIGHGDDSRLSAQLAEVIAVKGGIVESSAVVAIDSGAG
jgi:hypothetical protein